MFSLRPALRPALRAATKARSFPVAFRGFSSKDVVEQDEEEIDAVTIIQERRDALSKKSQHLVWESPEQLPAAPLPEDPKELVALDAMDVVARTKADGETRTVIIRQDKANVKQNPLNVEKIWRISLVEDGQQAEKWENSLMGWSSSADPYQSEPPLTFETALEAVYFAKKKGWQYSVTKPIMRTVRTDGAQYQDNFLPQKVVSMIQRERKQCKQWQRAEAGTSHYFRPLRYHGKGVVPQYGTNPKEETMPHVEGYYKMR